MTIGPWGHHSPLRHADVLNGWSHRSHVMLIVASTDPFIHKAVIFNSVENLWYSISDLQLEYDLLLNHCRASVAIDKRGKMYAIVIFVLENLSTMDSKYLIKSYDLEHGISGEWRTISFGSLSKETRVSLLLWHRGMIYSILNNGSISTIEVDGTIHEQITMEIPFELGSVIPYYTT